MKHLLTYHTFVESKNSNNFEEDNFLICHKYYLNNSFHNLKI